MTKLDTHGLELVRSDLGDGGWSLHSPEIEDWDGYLTVLHSGDAEWLPETLERLCGEWNRPDQSDYDAAWEQAKKLVDARAAAR